MKPIVDDALSQKTEREVVEVLVHMKRLLRVRNRLCSPLLQLPTETIVRILSFIMAGSATYISVHTWGSIDSTCHRIYKIMRNATELWWKVDCARAKVAHLTFVRSKGNPQVIVSDLGSLDDQRLVKTERILNSWRVEGRFKGHRLHTLEFSGSQSTFIHFSWIIERPLPRLERLKLHVIDSADEVTDEDEVESTVLLELPVGMPLQVLDLRNVILPWSSQSQLFNGLRELHLDFGDCDPAVTIPEDELFGIFDASPQLERLSLVWVGHEVPLRNGQPIPPKRVLQLPNLVSLKLDNSPLVVKYTLEYMDLPAIASLEICSFVSLDTARTLKNSFFPNDRIPTRLFPSPPTFAVRSAGEEELAPSIELDIGSIKLQLDFPFGQGERGRDIVMSCISQLVPPSVTTLKLEYTKLDEQGWRDFFTSHPQVRSIECSEFCNMPVSKSLWGGLSSPGEGDTDVPCPRLESILLTSFVNDVLFTPLSDCLRNRQTAGFKLGLLKFIDYHRFMSDVDGFREEFGPLVEIVDTGKHKPGSLAQKVRLVSMRELGVY